MRIEGRDVVKKCVLLAGALVLCAQSHGSDAVEEKRMNVLLLIVDDLNSWLLGDTNRYAGKVVPPHIQRLAESGVLFTRAYTASPVCSPSRTAFFCTAITCLTNKSEPLHGYISIRDETGRYIRYTEGQEEFYDCIKDPHEWTNHIGDPEYAPAINAFRASVPAQSEMCPPLPARKRRKKKRSGSNVPLRRSKRTTTEEPGRSGSVDSKPDKPNIVFILADDLGYGDLACYGHPYAKTPALDKLASEGTMFHRFYVTGVTCCPSRTGFMTSRHPARYPKYMADFGFAGRITVTELLQQAGYRTGHFGKWHMGPEDRDGTYGIDQISTIGSTKKDPGGRDAGLFEAAMDFIEANKDVPFYVNVWGHITHYPVDPPSTLADRFKDVVVDRDDFDAYMQKKFDTCERIGGDLNDSMRNYLGDVYSLDRQVGRLLRKIDELGLRDNTIVVFSSDQGPAPVLTKNKPTDPFLTNNPSRNMLGYAGGLRGGKHTQWEGGVRAPFIIRWPGRVPAGTINRTSVFSGMDWLPTVCAVAGIPMLSKPGQTSPNSARGSVTADLFEGEDVSDIWFGADRSRVAPLFWKASNVNAGISMLSGNWKLHRSRGTIALYNLAADPGERRNVQEKHPAIVSALKKQADLWNASLPTAYIRHKKCEIL